MSKFIKNLILGGFVAGFLSIAAPALAYSPTLSANYQGGNDNVQITVSSAQPYSQINLSYRQSSTLWTTVNNIGQTDQSGYFTQVISMPSDGSSSQVQLYVTVGGQQSSTISIYPGSGGTGGCGYYGCNVGGLTISPSSLNLSVGQSASANVSIGSYIYSGSYYISSNSNSNVASASISGSTINVYGNTSGSTTIAVCSTSPTCAYLYVAVSGNSGGSLSLSQTSVSLSVGQSMTVTAYNAPAVYISSNSNPSVVTSSLDINKINLYANSAGSSSIYVCAISSSTQCAYIYVTVSGSGTGGYGSIYFAVSSVSLSAGQSQTVTIYNNNNYNYGSYYISSNSNSNVASASISGTSLYISALVSGTTNISVCQNNVSSCATLYITVSGSGTGNNQVSIRDNYYSPQTITVPAGTDITWRNEGSMSHTVTFSAPYSDSGTIYSGGTYTKTFATPGTYYYNCRFHSGMTGTVIVTASGGGTGNVWFSPANPNLYVGQSLAVSINSSAYAAAYPYYTNAYYIASNSNSNVASASISGTVLNLYAYQNGSTNISVCHSSLGFCSTLYVTVGGYYTGGGLQYPGGGVLGASTYPNGQLISENGTVYIVYKNTKTGFVSASVFTGLGFKFANVSNVGASGLVDSGYIIRSTYASHPWGTWVKSGTTVYMVHEQGLIPVPDWNTFLNNGGQASFIVSANSYDLSLPRLSAMTYGDVRLQ